MIFCFQNSRGQIRTTETFGYIQSEPKYDDYIYLDLFGGYWSDKFLIDNIDYL